MQRPPAHSPRPRLLDSLRPVAASLFPSRIQIVSAPKPPAPPSYWTRMRAWFAVFVVASFAAASAAAMPHEPTQLQPRPATPELKTTVSGDLTRWHDAQVEITLDPSLDELGPAATDTIRNAYGEWLATDAELPKARFVVAKNKTPKAKRDGENRVIAAPIKIPGHENDLAITVSHVSSNGAIIEADIVINTRHTFTVSDDSCVHAYDLRSVVTHEVGHFYGLGEDRVDTDATMYFETSRCETKKRTLSLPDIDTVSVLYEGGWEEQEPGVSCSTVAHSPSRPSASFLAFVAAMGAFFIARRQRR